MGTNSSHRPNPSVMSKAKPGSKSQGMSKRSNQIRSQSDKTVIEENFFKIVRSIYEELNTPLSLGLALCLDAGDYESIVTHEMREPSQYLTANDYFDDATALALLSKCEGLPTGIKTDNVAIDKALEAERACFFTNERFKDMDLSVADRDVAASIQYAVEKLDLCLNDPPSSFLGSTPRYSKGATVSHKRDKASLPYKLCGEISLTRRALPHFLDLICSEPVLRSAYGSQDSQELKDYLRELGLFEAYREAMGHFGLNIRFVEGNHILTVPKNGKTDRTIAKEPSGNIVLQRILGVALSQRMFSTFGIDLSKAPVKNQALAREGSLTDEISTIDLKSASDNISLHFVRWLFLQTNGTGSLQWLSLLEDTRSPVSSWPLGQRRDLFSNKFATMGNGYTFELETLIFYCLSLGVAKHLGVSKRKISVFGDDIAVPTKCVDLLQRVLQFCGFTVNTEKSFTEGPFRESCGMDWYRGRLVTPVYFREIPKGIPDMYRVLNKVSQLALNSYWMLSKEAPPSWIDPNYNLVIDGVNRDLRWKKVWTAGVHRIPAVHRLFGPKSLGDAVIWNSRTHSRSSFYVHHGLVYLKSTLGTVSYSLDLGDCRQWKVAKKLHVSPVRLGHIQLCNALLGGVERNVFKSYRDVVSLDYDVPCVWNVGDLDFV